MVGACSTIGGLLPMKLKCVFCETSSEGFCSEHEKIVKVSRKTNESTSAIS